MYIAKVGMNPFKQMWKVLRFAWKNKYPLNRSSFTYCEETTPSRLDLGKQQYGGPFTTEEVEDVKTFFRLILLLIAIFGYHISGDGLLVAHYIQKFSCPASNVLGFIVLYPGFMSFVVVLLGIPLVKCLPSVHRLIPNMLKRIGIGLLVLLTQDIMYMAMIAFPVDNETAEEAIDDQNGFNGFYGFYCYSYTSHKLRNGFVSVNNTYLWMIIPQLLNGLAQLLVPMTTLEFICAQAPRTMQGLLIGFWYAMFSIRYILMSSLDNAISSWLGLVIYQASRCGLIFLSLLLYLCLSRTYQYRIRDWVVHVQWMVEDIIERRIDQEERYWEERMAEQQITIDCSSSEND